MSPSLKSGASALRRRLRRKWPSFAMNRNPGPARGTGIADHTRSPPTADVAAAKTTSTASPTRKGHPFSNGWSPGSGRTPSVATFAELQCGALTCGTLLRRRLQQELSSWRARGWRPPVRRRCPFVGHRRRRDHAPTRRRGRPHRVTVSTWRRVAASSDAAVSTEAAPPLIPGCCGGGGAASADLVVVNDDDALPRSRLDGDRPSRGLRGHHRLSRDLKRRTKNEPRLAVP